MSQVLSQQEFLESCARLQPVMSKTVDHGKFQGEKISDGLLNQCSLRQCEFTDVIFDSTSLKYRF